MVLFLTRHFVTAFLIIVFSLKLAGGRDFKNSQIRYLWLSVICTALLILQDVLETEAAADPAYIEWRRLLCVIGYVLRPVSALGILLVVAHRFPHRELLWIPVWINAAIMCTAFFSPLAFTFSEDYAFTLGPLGYSAFIVGFLYIFLILFFLWKTYGFRLTWESTALYFCGFGTVICTLIDHFHGDARLNSAIIISAIFCYLFLLSHDMNRDQLTGLLNRNAFYRDAEVLEEKITAMAILDMMGLRELNDDKGYREGDQALRKIGACLEGLPDRQVQCYRISSAEFLMVFLLSNERESRALLDKAHTGIQGLGYRMSVGFAARSPRETPDSLYQRAEKEMRSDRIAFYRRPANNRRKI